MALISVGGCGYREMLIDDTSIWSSDDIRGAGRGQFTLGEGSGHLLKQLLTDLRLRKFNIIALKVSIFHIYTIVGTLGM